MSRILNQPQCGYWAIRLAGGAPEVGASIQWEQSRCEPGVPTNLLDRSPILTARIDGKIVTIDEVWERRGRPVSEEFYRWLVADRAWARAHAPHLPEANPRQPTDLRRVAPIMPPRGKA